MVVAGDAAAQLDLATYLATLPAGVTGLVLRAPYTSLALLRSLPPLAKQVVLRLVYVDAPVSRDAVRSWARHGLEASHQKTLQHLELLAVLQADRQGAVQLNPDFKRCLRTALSGRGLGGDADGSGQQSYQGPPPVRELSEQAARQWQAVLLYVLDPDADLSTVGNTDASGFSILDLLLAAGLIASADRTHVLTRAGLRYLLQPTGEQVWLLLREYIRQAEQAAALNNAGEGLAATLSFLMQLSFRRVWQPYPLACLTTQERSIAGHMAQLGLVATCSQGGADYFCATPLAASLCGGSGGAPAAAAEGGGAAAGSGRSNSSSSAATTTTSSSSSLEHSAYIIVETNFRVYAHTSSPLQRQVLGSLMRTDCLLPNLYVGTLTRETFMAALEAGVGAADITRFLQQHAHPQVARRVPSVPENVQEQLMLWEGEARRVSAESVSLYSSFEDEALFGAALNHAQGLGELLWVDAKERRFIVRRSGHEAVRNFIVEFKAQRLRQQQA